MVVHQDQRPKAKDTITNSINKPHYQAPENLRASDQEEQEMIFDQVDNLATTTQARKPDQANLSIVNCRSRIVNNKIDFIMCSDSLDLCAILRKSLSGVTQVEFNAAQTKPTSQSQPSGQPEESTSILKQILGR